MLSTIYNACGNRLLASLPESIREHLVPYIESVSLSSGEVLSEPGRPLNQVYFPTTAIVSLVSVLGDGSSTQVAIVGNEGLVSIAVFLGGDTLPCRALVQTAGWAYRLKERLFRQYVDCSADLQPLLLPHAAALLAQVGQTVACNRHHSIEHQLCRWLLLNLDRLPSNTVITTHAQIAAMLGVRREGVTEAIGKLTTGGLIHHTRGCITVLDRRALEGRACECYGVVRNECRRLLSELMADRDGARRDASPWTVRNGRGTARSPYGRPALHA